MIHNDFKRFGVFSMFLLSPCLLFIYHEQERCKETFIYHRCMTYTQTENQVEIQGEIQADVTSLWKRRMERIPF